MEAQHQQNYYSKYYCPFHIFPEELWEFILNELVDTTDISNLFTAIPQLKRMSIGHEFDCLIAEIMPLFLSKHFDKFDILKCRLVSKRWRNSIDSTLQTHPDRIPYKSNPIKTQISPHHLNYRELPVVRVRTNFHRVLLDSAEIPEHLSSNPFPGHHVTIPVNVNGYDDHRHAVWLIDAQPLLKKLGQHICHLRAYMKPRWYTDQDLFVENGIMPLLACLELLPNLKSLYLDGWYPSPSNAVILPLNPADLDIPFKLETLDLSHFTGMSKDLFDFLISTTVNDDGIRKLGIHLDHWDPKLGPLFPYLTELHLIVCCEAKDDIVRLAQIFRDLHCEDSPDPEKVTLDFSVRDVDVVEILECIQPYDFKYIQINGSGLIEEDTWESSELVVNSVQNLVMEIHPRLKYRFLRRLPNLQTLTFILGIDYWDIVREDNENNTNASSFWKSISNFYLEGKKNWDNFKCFWEELPSLQMLTIVTDMGEDSYQYARECKGIVFTPLASDSNSPIYYSSDTFSEFSSDYSHDDSPPSYSESEDL